MQMEEDSCRENRIPHLCFKKSIHGSKETPGSKKEKDPLPGPGASEKPYRTIFEHTGLPTIIIEKDSTISLANGAFPGAEWFSPAGDRGKEKMDGVCCTGRYR